MRSGSQEWVAANREKKVRDDKAKTAAISSMNCDFPKVDSMGTISRWVFLLATGLATTGVLGIAQEKPDHIAARRLPGGGVADPAGLIGYWPNSAGGIDALDLGFGKVLWSNNDANIPFIATNNHLIARASVPDKPNQFRVVVLEAKDGKRVMDSKPIELDDWVRVGVERGHSFTAAARLESDRLYLAWEARAWYDRGAAPSEEQEKEARKHAFGAVRIDLRSGKVEKLKAAAPGLPLERASEKAGDLMITVELGTPSRTNEPGVEVRSRTLHAADASGKTVWSREIAPLKEFLPLK
jgi:hypothetical protein